MFFQDQDEDSGYLNGTESSDPESGDLPPDSGVISPDSSDLPLENSDITQETSDITQESSDIPLESSDLLPESSDKPPKRSDLPLYTSDLSLKSCGTGTDSNNVDILPALADQIKPAANTHPPSETDKIMQKSGTTIKGTLARDPVGLVSSVPQKTASEVIEQLQDSSLEKTTPEDIVEKASSIGSQLSTEELSIEVTVTETVLDATVTETVLTDAMINLMRNPAHELQFGDVAFEDIVQHAMRQSKTTESGHDSATDGHQRQQVGQQRLTWSEIIKPATAINVEKQTERVFKLQEADARGSTVAASHLGQQQAEDLSEEIENVGMTKRMTAKKEEEKVSNRKEEEWTHVGSSRRPKREMLVVPASTAAAVAPIKPVTAVPSAATKRNARRKQAAGQQEPAKLNKKMQECISKAPNINNHKAVVYNDQNTSRNSEQDPGSNNSKSRHGKKCKRRVAAAAADSVKVTAASDCQAQTKETVSVYPKTALPPLAEIRDLFFMDKEVEIIELQPASSKVQDNEKEMVVKVKDGKSRGGQTISAEHGDQHTSSVLEAVR